MEMPMRPKCTLANSKKILVSVILLALVLAFAEASPSKVETLKTDDGWRLQVNGKDFQIKGVVWSFTPIGENYSYDLFTKPEDYIRRMIDTDMALLKRMGATVIRSFSTIPPEWIEYIYARYGIMTIVNDLFGRYGVTVNGVWHANTDYSDPATREFLLEQARKTFETYKNTPGVLFFMLGNESNYGLEWKSNTIENLPGGQRMDAKARYLYSLFGEAVRLGKSLDQNHPVGIVNGDLGYLDMISELCPDLDILGVNTYRGRKAYNGFYASVEETLDKPLVFTEFGADAFNVATGMEDQYNQASFLKDQWEELYTQSFGKGKSQNVLGGFVFEWIDEWWKHGMETGLDIHDTKGTWNNGAYDFDAMPGRMNMNEEWFGIVAQGELTEGGIHRRIPRASYFLLQKIWALDIYRSTSKQIKDLFSALSIADALATSQPAYAIDALQARRPLSIKGAIETRFFLSGTSDELANGFEAVKDSLESRHTETASIDIEFRPVENLSAGITVKFAGKSLFFNATQDPLSWFASPAAITWEKSGETPVSLYSAWATYDTTIARAELFYRTGHSDWKLTGDLFGFMPEAFDRYGMDLNRQRAPFGIEISMKESLDGLVLYAGPELYAGALPQAVAKYYRDFKHFSFGAIHQEELAYPDESLLTAAQITEYEKQPLSRRSSLFFQGNFLPVFDVQLGLMLGSPEKIGATYTNAIPTTSGGGSGGSGYWIYTNQVTDILDSLGGKLRVATDALPYLDQAYLQATYMGALASAEPAIARGGSQIADPGTGNRWDVEAGFIFIYGNLIVSPKFLYREPVYGPLPTVGLFSIEPRNYMDLFHVRYNRKAIQGEAVVTWDPTGATWFHDWNNDEREDAPFAASLSFLYNFYLGPTDAAEYVANYTGTVGVFTDGMPAISGTWSLKGRIVARLSPNVRLIATGTTGLGQSGGDPAKDPVYYGGGTLRLGVGRMMIDSELYFNSWGPEPWYREFQATFPIQAKLGISWGFSPIKWMNPSNRVGLDLLYRSFGANSPADQSANGTIDGRFELQAWMNLSL
jgi:hypothetical protein